MLTPRRHVGTQLRWLEVCPSTQDEARRMALEAQAPSGTVVATHDQTAGRGRRGRSWHHGGELGLACTLILRPPLPVERFPLLTVALGTGTARALRTLTGQPVGMHWPNDLVDPDDRKLGGLLTETVGLGESSPLVLVGLGLNLLQGPGDFPPSIGTRATSLAQLLGGEEPPTRMATLEAVLDGWEAAYQMLLEARDHDLEVAWREVSADLGRHVLVSVGESAHRGVVEGFRPGEGLLLRQEDGTLLRLVGETIASFSFEGERPHS